MEFKGKSNEFILSGEETPLEPRTMQYRFAKILKNVNLPSVHFHSLRHVFVSTCIKLGFDVKSLSELLGHSSVEVTLKELSENNLNIYTCLICPVCRYNTLKYVSIPAVLCLTQNKLSCV